MGASSLPLLYFTPDYYFTSDTYLQLTYPSSLITISSQTVTNCQVVSSSGGSILLSSWSNPFSSLQSIQSLTVTNPQAQVPSITITGRLYFNSSSVQYLI